MSFDTVKANLEKEGEKLLDELRDYLSVKQDVFRSNFCDSYYEEIMKMKSDFILVETAALHEQLLREGKPIGDTFIWYDKYNKYLHLISKFSKNIDPFLEIEGLEDFRDELKNMKTRLVETAPFGSVKPDFESIIRILKGVEKVVIKLYEDLYFDVKRFLMRYELYQNLISL